MLKLRSAEDLDALHAGNVKESLHLEYKASDAIDKKNDVKKVEMARDVSAFANADGGQIVYAMTEKDHEPAGLDQGCDPKEYPEIWFEQVLQQHVTPRLVGVRPYHIPLKSGRVAVVIDIPPTNADPHQVSDGRYYRRHNFNRLIMEHYEVKGAFNRLTTPEPFVELALEKDPIDLTWTGSDTHSAPVALTASVGNRSVTPTLYTAIFVFLDAELVIIQHGARGIKDVQLADGHGIRSLNYLLVTPHHMPLFREMTFLLGDGPIRIAIPPKYREGDSVYRIGYSISSPGYSTERFGELVKRGQRLTLRWHSL